uniref:Uncharacterized protein n=1 Tax=viral metagenome TaxID=1070528 RepID=A0A6M3INK1_9ZZZZ
MSDQMPPAVGPNVADPSKIELPNGVVRDTADPRNIVIGNVVFTPHIDLTGLKDSLTRQRDTERESHGQTKEALVDIQAKASDWEAKFNLTQGTLDESRKLILDTQTKLTDREKSVVRRDTTLSTKEAALAQRELALRRKELSVEHGVDVAILEEHTDPKDMEIAILRAKAAGKTVPLPNKEDFNSGDGRMAVNSNITDPLAVARELLKKARASGTSQSLFQPKMI